LNKIDDELKHDLSLVNIYGFHCSINAASAEVYKEICGGDWLSVMGNLDFVLKLREKSGRSFWVSISMVVTNRNYRQVVDFAKLGLEKKADKIIYYSLNETSFNQHQRLDENEKNLVLQMLKEAVFSENPEKFEVSPDLRVE
jgi:MoaA/NifB/PqqE/SkfB family radical SAM enzyme